MFHGINIGSFLLQKQFPRFPVTEAPEEGEWIFWDSGAYGGRYIELRSKDNKHLRREVGKRVLQEARPILLEAIENLE